MIKAAIAETIGKPGKFFPKAAVLQNLFSLAFNRNGSKEIISSLPYHKRNFHLDQLIYSYYPHFEEFLETLIKVLVTYRKKKKRGQVMDFDDLLENWLELLVVH